MARRLSPAAITALKEALVAIYWYKSDLRTFVGRCVTDRTLIASLDWNAVKRQVSSDLIEALLDRGENGVGDLTRLAIAVAEVDSFEHLARLEDGEAKAKVARAAVNALRKYVAGHQEQASQRQSATKRQEAAATRIRASAAVQEKLEELLRRYQRLVTSRDAQARGFELERLMYEVFKLFDLDPKASFRTIGEQVDGAFALDGTDYLFEGKWVSGLIEAGDLDVFRAKLSRKLDNTLGLFLAVNGFNQAALTLSSGARESLLLMDGADLMAVLEGRIDLASLLVRKRRHASQTGNIFLPVRAILGP